MAPELDSQPVEEGPDDGFDGDPGGGAATPALAAGPDTSLVMS
jgi:hypothetical protein